MLDGPELGDQAVELLSFIGIAYRMINGFLGRTYYIGTHLDPSQVKNVQGDPESFTPLAKKVGCRYLAIIEKDLPGRGPFYPHFFLFRIESDARKIPFNNKSTHHPVVVYLGKNGHHIRKSGIGDPHLLPVQDIMFPIL